jgi:Protein of unknown function (DUF3108)
MLASRPVTRGTILAFGITLAIASSAPDRAQAQTKLTANYTISIARIPIGRIGWTVDIGENSYATSGSGEASGLLSILASGKGTAATQGSVKDGELLPTSFSSDISRDDDKAALKMVLDHGAASEVSGDAPEASDTRVPLTEAHRRNIVDPLTALLIPAAAGDGITRAACERTLPIFDGHRRYNLKLTFKRMDKVKADKRNADGPSVVCAVAFEPVAGHRADSKLVRFLAHDRDIELWLAPIAGARVLAPVRLSISNMLGNLVVQATEFQSTATDRRASIDAGARAD